MHGVIVTAIIGGVVVAIFAPSVFYTLLALAALGVGGILYLDHKDSGRFISSTNIDHTFPTYRVLSDRPVPPARGMKDITPRARDRKRGRV